MVTRLESKVIRSSQCLSKMLKMLRTQVLLLFCLARATNAIYKQWIPDTNYENKTNWDKGDVPCGNDRVHFSSQSKVSVFVETMHAVQEILLPINGEFILNPGAGFHVVSGQDPSCGGGVTTNFKDSDSLQWFNPALWQTAATQNDLHQGNFLFSVHEESVPCQNDEVIFKALSSFRSDTSCSQSTIHVKSVSVLGKMFDDRSEFSRYLSSHSGQLQFHGSSAVTVGNPSCEDSTGCVCENSVHHQLICSTVTCASLNCKNTLLPVGHCCEVCGAIITIDYAENFNLQHYRDRIRHLFLILPQYKSLQLGMSKVLKPQSLMRLIPFGTSCEIQVVIVDGDMGKLSNTLAQDIIKDAKSHGSELGITKAEIQGSTESNSAMVVGVVFAVLLMIAFIAILVVLNRKGVVQMPAMPSVPSLSLFRRSPHVEDINGDIDCGFDNPMFDVCDMPSALPGLYDSNTISLTRTGVHFINPVYDEHETDFTV